MSLRFCSVAALMLYAAATVAVAAPAYSDSNCLSRPTLVCLLVPTTSADLEGKVGAVYGAATFTPTWSRQDPGCEEEGDDTYSGPECLTRINGTIYGLGNATPHGWHIHEKGDISSSDGTATGGHYNPANVSHALPTSKIRHVGDLGNLRPDGKGIAHISYTIDLDTYDVLGRGLIVHAAEDDGGQPTGNAGARLAQCVLGRVN